MNRKSGPIGRDPPSGACMQAAPLGQPARSTWFKLRLSCPSSYRVLTSSLVLSSRTFLQKRRHSLIHSLLSPYSLSRTKMATFEVGSLVTVHSLSESEPYFEHNGAAGVVDSALSLSHHLVDVHLGGRARQTLSLKPANLRLRAAAPSPPWFDEDLGPQYLAANKSMIHQPMYRGILDDFFLGADPDGLISPLPDGSQGIHFLPAGSEPAEKLTMLHSAAVLADIPYARGLLRAGATLDFGPKTPLAAVCKVALRDEYAIASPKRARDRMDMIEFLISVGADASRLAAGGKELLPSVVAAGDLRLCEALFTAPVGGMELLKQAPRHASFAKGGKARKPYMALVKRLKSEKREVVVLCPCGSELPLAMCHDFDDGREKGVPVHPKRPCPCTRTVNLRDKYLDDPSTRKPYPTYGKCCLKRKRILKESLALLFEPMAKRSDSEIKADQGRIDARIRAAERIGMSKDELDALPPFDIPGAPPLTVERYQKWYNERILDALLPDLIATKKIDLAFLHALRKSDFGCCRPWRNHPGRVLDKGEMEKRRDEWNAWVDEYIGLKEDARSTIEIEKAAKVGWAGGPLFARCGGCGVIEGEPSTFERCSACKAVAYCSKSCQKSQWNAPTDGHKAACGTYEAEPSLPSSAAFSKVFKTFSELQ